MRLHESRQFIDFFEKNDRLGALFNCRILSLTDQECVSEYEARPEHYNPNGVLHGGALFTVMDSSQGAFVHFNLDTEKFQFAATGTATVRYSAPVRNGKLTIKTALQNIKNRKIFVISEAFTQDGQMVARLEETWIGILKTSP